MWLAFRPRALHNSALFAKSTTVFVFQQIVEPYMVFCVWSSVADMCGHRSTTRRVVLSTSYATPSGGPVIMCCLTKPTDNPFAIPTIPAGCRCALLLLIVIPDEMQPFKSPITDQTRFVCNAAPPPVFFWNAEIRGRNVPACVLHAWPCGERDRPWPIQGMFQVDVYVDDSGMRFFEDELVRLTPSTMEIKCCLRGAVE